MIRRVQVMGSSGSGKSTLGLRLAQVLGVPHVELDALFWRPNWTESEPEVFRARVAEATAGDGWVVSGNYTGRLNGAVWERAELIVWLDLPLHVTIPRQLTRSWRRWRTHEVLWGTNTERFWPQLAVWDPTSLVGYSLRARPRFQRTMVEAMADPRYAHARWVRLTSQRQADRFLAAVRAQQQHEAA